MKRPGHINHTQLYSVIILLVLTTVILPGVNLRAAADPNKPAAVKDNTAKSLYSEPLVDPKALLIREDAIRSQLGLDAAANAKLDALCYTLDPLLFAMRDVPAGSTNPMALQYSAQIQQELKALPEILTPDQQQRLEELTLQYHGFAVLFWPRVISQMQLTDKQLYTISKIISNTKKELENFNQKNPSQNQQSSAREYQQLMKRQEREIFAVMSLEQKIQWEKILGIPFDFSILRPLSFRAPELTDVTAWINSGPLTLSSLRGKVVIVHFWTFGCANCINNYPAYKRWYDKYKSSDVVMIGIHTPETPSETDVNTVTSKARENGLKFPIAIDNNKANWNAWSNNVWPSVYLVDKKGRVRYWWYGELNWQGAAGEPWITERIDQLLKE